jgi:hypothetical protein
VGDRKLPIGLARVAWRKGFTPMRKRPGKGYHEYDLFSVNLGNPLSAVSYQGAVPDGP